MDSLTYALDENHDLENLHQYHYHCQHCGGLCCYADDSTYTKSDKDPVALKVKIDESYQMISDYMANNKLVLNSDKTHLLVMASARNHKTHRNYGITLNTGAEIIKPQDNEKLLGGFISNDLTWKENIRDNAKSLLNMITTRINALSKISRINNFRTRKMIANGIVMSKLIYLIQLWGGSPKYLIRILQKLQNRAARLVTKKNIFTPIRVLLTQCGWLSVHQLVTYHNVLQTYKTKTSKRPGYLYEKFSKEFGANTRLAKRNLIRIDKIITSDLGLKNFTHLAAEQWNGLPQEIRSISKQEIFKKEVKNWIRNNVPIDP